MGRKDGRELMVMDEDVVCDVRMGAWGLVYAVARPTYMREAIAFSKKE